MKNFKSVFLIATFFFGSLSCENNELREVEEFLIVSDLTELMDKTFNSASASREVGYPWTGCKDFDVTLTTLFGAEVEFTITHCCVSGVCAATEFWNLLDGIFGEDDDEENGRYRYPDEITISKSSSFMFENYSVSILSGTYHVNQDGSVDGILYKAILIN